MTPRDDECRLEYIVTVDGEDVDASTAGVLERLAEITGSSAIARAARSMRQACSPGRPPIDDRAALAEAEHLLLTGRARSFRSAALAVARTRGSKNPRAFCNRLIAKRAHRRVGASE